MLGLSGIGFLYRIFVSDFVLDFLYWIFLSVLVLDFLS